MTFFSSRPQEEKGEWAFAGEKEIDSEKSKIILIGDTQRTSRFEFWREQNDEARERLVAEIIRRDPAMVIHLGDLTLWGAFGGQWKWLGSLFSPLLERRIPLLPILGNHDYAPFPRRALSHYFSHFPHIEGRRWYSRIWKGLGMIFLDGNFSRLTKEEWREQKRWMEDQLSQWENREEIRAIFLACHQPPFSQSKTISPSRRVRRDFAHPFLNCKKGKIFFSGHCHSYERFLIRNKHFVVSGGGGGPRQKLKKSPFQAGLRGEVRGPHFHFCQLQWEGENLWFEMVSWEGKEEFLTRERLAVLPFERVEDGKGKECEISIDQ